MRRSCSRRRRKSGPLGFPSDSRCPTRDAEKERCPERSCGSRAGTSRSRTRLRPTPSARAAGGRRGMSEMASLGQMRVTSGPDRQTSAQQIRSAFCNLVVGAARHSKQRGEFFRAAQVSAESSGDFGASGVSLGGLQPRTPAEPPFPQGRVARAQRRRPRVRS